MFEIEQHGEVAVLSMKSGKANAQNIEFCREIVARFEEIGQSSAKAVVLTGHGKIFSAGVDLPRLIEEGPEYTREFIPALSKTIETIFFFPKPVIAAINGHAIAGGCVLACCADFRVMADAGGRMGVPELLVGVPFPAIALEVMRYVTVPAHFEELLYTGATFTPAESRQRGLVNTLVESDRLLEHALQMASNMATLPSAAFALTKSQVHGPSRSFFEANGATIDREVIEQWTSPATIELIKSYVARTLKKS